MMCQILDGTVPFLSGLQYSGFPFFEELVRLPIAFIYRLRRGKDHLIKSLPGFLCRRQVSFPEAFNEVSMRMFGHSPSYDQPGIRAIGRQSN
jgi:hypothetical protein